MVEKYAGSALVVVTTAIALALVKKKWTSRNLPYPPGPKGYPIIGNLLDFPENPIWEGFTRMAKEYNTDLLHLDVMGSHLVVLNDGDAAADLLERRSVIYADRPRLPMVGELMGCSWSFSIMPYGNAWRVHRRLLHRFFNASVVNQFDDKIHKAVNVFLHRLSESPERFLKHVRFLTGSLALSVAYGLNVGSESEEVYSTSEGAMNAFDIAMVPGTFLVDTLPILKYVPEWFPGAGFKTFARIAKKNIDDSVNSPFKHVKESFEADTITASSFVTTCLEELPELSKDGVDEEVIRGVGASIYFGEHHCHVASAIKSFFLAATLHPEVVRLAQRELDEVLGGERLPDFSDKPQLPYISAVVKEVLRWRPPTPLGSGHRLMEDDTYKGLFIPAGAIVIDNTWAIFRNESVYPDAHAFKPDRFLKDGRIDLEVKDPEESLFGWGRRVCPGRHFALRLLFLTVARTLATFDVSKCLDGDGNPIVPDGKYTPGVISHPLPFRSDIKPRSTHALSLIEGS
ncbi:CyP450 monooxygenase [Thelephora ganbajun]|uniref:CyP450 monooxygenase n=1 Tax=Thelephora ganbajun TaxID=370292 RepID=A0ACB6Z829_THEGA|nr:CyP450 monooxygenase [Thelephora ganbajun]